MEEIERVVEIGRAADVKEIERAADILDWVSLSQARVGEVEDLNPVKRRERLIEELMDNRRNTGLDLPQDMEIPKYKFWNMYTIDDLKRWPKSELARARTSKSKRNMILNADFDRAIDRLNIDFVKKWINLGLPIDKALLPDEDSPFVKAVRKLYLRIQAKTVPTVPALNLIQLLFQADVNEHEKNKVIKQISVLPIRKMR